MYLLIALPAKNLSGVEVIARNGIRYIALIIYNIHSFYQYNKFNKEFITFLSPCNMTHSSQGV